MAVNATVISVVDLPLDPPAGFVVPNIHKAAAMKPLRKDSRVVIKDVAPDVAVLTAATIGLFQPVKARKRCWDCSVDWFDAVAKREHDIMVLDMDATSVVQLIETHVDNHWCIEQADCPSACSIQLGWRDCRQYVAEVVDALSPYASHDLSFID